MAENRPMTKDERRKIWEACIATYGADAQINMAIEEMSELIKELMKYKRTDSVIKVKDAIHEEMADVMIMMNQLVMIFDCETDLEFWMNIKTARQAERLRKESLDG